MLALRSLVFNVLFYLVLLALMVFGLPALLFGRWGVFFLANLWARASIFLMRVLCNLRVEYRGLENIPKGGYLLAAKHQSFMETFSLLPNTPDFAIILKRQLTYVPIFGLYLVVSRQIAINRAKGHSALGQILVQAGEILRAGRQVYIYPEGTRRAPGAKPAYKFGVAALYAATHVPCLPVALNTGLFWGRRGFARRPGVAVIEYLPAIPPGLDRDDFAKRLEDSIETACRRLNEEALRNDPSLAVVLASNAEPVAARASSKA